jgi:hypothetical protein
MLGRPAAALVAPGEGFFIGGLTVFSDRGQAGGMALCSAVGDDDLALRRRR